MTDRLRQFVGARAGLRCEYCQVPTRLQTLTFEVDYVIPVKHGGGDDPSNLAWSCYYCNCFKGSDLAGIDPQTKRIVRLYHPRKDRWDDHFRWSSARILGASAIGRATVAVLQFNSADAVAARSGWMSAGLFFDDAPDS